MSEVNKKTTVLSEETLIRSRKIMERLGMISKPKNGISTPIEDEIVGLNEKTVEKVVNDIKGENQPFIDHQKTKEKSWWHLEDNEIIL